MRTEYFTKIFLFVIFSFILVVACSDEGSNDSTDEFNGAECLAIREDCKTFAKVESWEHECTLTEPGTPGCLIEKEGLFNQAYYDCVKKKVGSECEGSLLWQNKCLEEYYYDKLNYDTFEQADEECMDKCVYSVDY
jgi:hypothetical protein